MTGCFHCTDGTCSCMFCGGTCQACAGRLRTEQENARGAQLIGVGGALRDTEYTKRRPR